MATANPTVAAAAAVPLFLGAFAIAALPGRAAAQATGDGPAWTGAIEPTDGATGFPVRVAIGRAGRVTGTVPMGGLVGEVTLSGIRLGRTLRLTSQLGRRRLSDMPDAPPWAPEDIEIDLDALVALEMTGEIAGDLISGQGTLSATDGPALCPLLLGADPESVARLVERAKTLGQPVPSRSECGRERRAFAWSARAPDRAVAVASAPEDPAPATPAGKAPAGEVVAAAKPDAAAGSPDAEIVFWESVRDSDDPAAFEAYLEQFPQGTFAPLARMRLARLTEPAKKPPATAAPVETKPPAPAEKEPPAAAAPVDAPPPATAREEKPPAAPRPAEPAFDRQTVRALQRSLRALGFDPGPADGIMGGRTRSAVAAFSARSGRDATLTPELMAHIIAAGNAAAAATGSSAGAGPPRHPTTWLSPTGNLVFRSLGDGPVEAGDSAFGGATTIYGTMRGGRFAGYWIYRGGRTNCAVPHLDSYSWGHIAIEFDPGFSSFKGRYGICDGPLDRRWDAKRGS